MAGGPLGWILYVSLSNEGVATIVYNSNNPCVEYLADIDPQTHP